MLNWVNGPKMHAKMRFANQFEDFSLDGIETEKKNNMSRLDFSLSPSGIQLTDVFCDFQGRRSHKLINVS